MLGNRRSQLLLALAIATALALPTLARRAKAQERVAQVPTTPAPTTPLAPLKPEKHGASRHRRATTRTAAAGPAEHAQPTLLGQYGNWGAYTASPGGKKICFALTKPTSSKTDPPNRRRDPSYMFISTRPADKVRNEVSIIIGYSFKPNSEATAEVGTTTYALYTQKDGAWINNAAKEAHMVEAMRAGESAVVKGVSSHGTRTTDVFSLKGLAQALDRTNEECK